MSNGEFLFLAFLLLLLIRIVLYRRDVLPPFIYLIDVFIYISMDL